MNLNNFIMNRFSIESYLQSTMLDLKELFLSLSLFFSYNNEFTLKINSDIITIYVDLNINRDDTTIKLICLRRLPIKQYGEYAVIDISYYGKDSAYMSINKWTKCPTGFDSYWFAHELDSDDSREFNITKTHTLLKDYQGINYAEEIIGMNFRDLLKLIIQNICVND